MDVVVVGMRPHTHNCKYKEQNMFKRISHKLFLPLIAALLCSTWLILAAWPFTTVHADGGGFPTDTPRPTATATMSSGKGLSGITSLATNTPTGINLPQSAASTPAGGAPAPSSGQSVAPEASGETAPVSGSPSGTSTAGGVPMLAIVGLAALATLGVVVLLLILRRRG